MVICQYVAPFVGAWIETLKCLISSFFSTVAPFVGAWIETAYTDCCRLLTERSLPSWERGLKLDEKNDVSVLIGRSLRGSVD